jgi:hypothetical protein
VIWFAIGWLHLLAMAFFLGGQIHPQARRAPARRGDLPALAGDRLDRAVSG